MKLYLTMLLMCLGVMSAGAQTYELGEVTKEELSQKTHDKDPSAPAAVLYSKGETYMNYSDNDGFVLVTEVEMKIKIYNKDGYEFAKKEIAFYDEGSQRETVDVSKAFTYNLEGGSIKKTKLRGEGEFTEEVNKSWKLKKIVMPDVKEGSIVEYRYKIMSPFITAFPEWVFQRGIPVNYSSYTTRVPEYFSYMPNFRGYFTPKVDKTTKNQSVTMISGGKANNSGSVQTNKIDYIDHITTYTLTDLPALKDEAFVSNLGNYTASIEHELSFTKYPNSPVKSYSSTWEDVTKNIYDNSNFGGELSKSGYFEDDVNALLSGVTSRQEKIAKLFNYVQQRMTWNGNYSYYCDEGVKRAYQAKSGNVAEINLMLTAMLRESGLDANPVLVSTRNNKVALFPNRTAFNYIICAVQDGDKLLMLDATSKSSAPGILPLRALSWTGRLIRKNGTSAQIELIPTSQSTEVSIVNASLSADGVLQGTSKRQYSDYNAYILKENAGGLSATSQLEKLEKTFKGMEAENYTLKDDEKAYKLNENYDFKHTGVCDIIGEKLYFNPMLFYGQNESPFKNEKREYPIDFVFPMQDKFLFTINLPEGYVIESVPAATSIVMDQNIGSFKYNVVAMDDKVQVRALFELNYAVVSQDYYSVLKNFFEKVVEKQSEKIVLAKKI